MISANESLAINSRRPTRAERELEVLNRAAFHVRPAGEFIRCIYRFRNEIYVVVRRGHFDARRALDLLRARLPATHRVTIVAEDPQAEMGDASLQRFLGQLAEVDRRKRRKPRR